MNEHDRLVIYYILYLIYILERYRARQTPETILRTVFVVSETADSGTEQYGRLRGHFSKRVLFDTT